MAKIKKDASITIRAKAPIKIEFKKLCKELNQSQSELFENMVLLTRIRFNKIKEDAKSYDGLFIMDDSGLYERGK